MATVIKLVNELIAKEDVNWGDSSSTFTRETYSGGSISVHYVDAEIIPSTTLGGYIGDHLHVQNTDTGTTGTTFIINSGGNSATLSTTGLTADRTFTFPDTSNQALVGATDLASVAASKGASTVGVQDAGLYFSGTNAETVLQEIGLDVATLQSSTHNSGMKNGFKLGYSSTTAITISGGTWAHNGTTNQHLYTASQVTFTLGPAGSNTSSSNLGANEIHYIYIHNASVVSAATRLLTATEFLNSTTAPSWSESKVGWYNSNDRCIGAVLTNGANAILDFDVFSGNFYMYDVPLCEYSLAAMGTTYTAVDVSSSVPVFSTMVKIILYGGAGSQYYFNTVGAAGVSKMADYAPANTSLTLDVPTTTAQIIYMYSAAGVNTAVHVAGYYINEL